MIEVRRLGHATLTTPDLGRQVAYYTEIIGLAVVDRSAKGALLASKQITEKYLPAYGLLLATNLWQWRLVTAQG